MRCSFILPSHTHKRYAKQPCKALLSVLMSTLVPMVVQRAVALLPSSPRTTLGMPSPSSMGTSGKGVVWMFVKIGLQGPLAVLVGMVVAAVGLLAVEVLLVDVVGTWAVGPALEVGLEVAGVDMVAVVHMVDRGEIITLLLFLLTSSPTMLLVVVSAVKQFTCEMYVFIPFPSN